MNEDKNLDEPEVGVGIREASHASNRIVSEKSIGVWMCPAFVLFIKI